MWLSYGNHEKLGWLKSITGIDHNLHRIILDYYLSTWGEYDITKLQGLNLK